MTRIAWLIGNWIAQLVFAFRVGYRDGSMLRPGTKPTALNESLQRISSEGDDRR